MYAAIGTDGTREVVWGLGATEAAAEADAARWAEDCDPELSRTVAVTGEIAERIRAGEVGVEDLGLSSDEPESPPRYSDEETDRADYEARMAQDER